MPEHVDILEINPHVFVIRRYYQPVFIRKVTRNIRITDG